MLTAPSALRQTPYQVELAGSNFLVFSKRHRRIAHPDTCTPGRFSQRSAPVKLNRVGSTCWILCPAPRSSERVLAGTQASSPSPLLHSQMLLLLDARHTAAFCPLPTNSPTSRQPPLIFEDVCGARAWTIAWISRQYPFTGGSPVALAGLQQLNASKQVRMQLHHPSGRLAMKSHARSRSTTSARAYQPRMKLQIPSLPGATTILSGYSAYCGGKISDRKKRSGFFIFG